MNVADLFVALTISNHLLAESMIFSARRERALAGVLILNGLVSPDPHKP
jgi:hypothetical protein